MSQLMCMLRPSDALMQCNSVSRWLIWAEQCEDDEKEDDGYKTGSGIPFSDPFHNISRRSHNLAATKK